MGENVIEIADLEFCYGRNKVIDQFSLSVSPGQVLGLIGRNGAGKTTTIHLLLGLLTCRKGHIRVLGLDPAHENIRILDRCGFFPEQGEPYDWMKVKHLFQLGRHAYSRWDDALCSRLCETLELDPRKRISDLSRGMLIKAKLIFVMAHRPELLLLDEPTNGLDPLSRVDVLSSIQSIARQQRCTVLISSHNLDEIAEIATHVCIIDQGKNLFTAGMDDIRTKFAVLECPLESTLSDPLRNQAVSSKTANGRMQYLVRDKTAGEVTEWMAAHGDRASLEAVNLKELFVFITRKTR